MLTDAIYYTANCLFISSNRKRRNNYFCFHFYAFFIWLAISFWMFESNFLQKNEIKLKAMTDSDMLTSAGFYAHYYLINWFVRINLVGYKATNTNKKIYSYEIQQTSISLNTYSLSHSSKVFSGEHKWMSRERCQQKEKKTYSIIYLVKFYFTVENGPSVVINDIIQKSAIRKSIRKYVCECVCKSQNGAKSLKRTKHKHINTQSVCMKNFVYT